MPLSKMTGSTMFSMKKLGFRLISIRAIRNEGRQYLNISCARVQGLVFSVCSGSEEGSYLRRIDFCITQL